MSILDRDSLEQSPLSDLHTIASELSIDGYRRLRKADLIDAILARQGGGEQIAPPTESTGEEAESPEAEESGARRRRWRRGAREREEGGDGEAGQNDRHEGEGPREIEREVDRAEREQAEREPPEREPPERAAPADTPPSRPEPEVVEGVVELLAGGSGFVRVHPPEPSDDDVYVSAAQVKRCELVTGDRVSGPRRAPRRSERFASLLRVDTVNGRPADELAESVRFDDRPVGFPDQRLELWGADPELAILERAAPVGRGSRVIVWGPAASGKTEVVRRLARAVSAEQALQLWLVVLGARPEEQSESQQLGVTPAVSLSFAASAEAQSQALDGVVEQVRRLVARGGHAVLLIDTLDGVDPAVARKAMASARNLVDGGSLTVIATASAPLGGETTAVALQPPRPGDAGVPLVDEERSWTIRRELLG